MENSSLSRIAFALEEINRTLQSIESALECCKNSTTINNVFNSPKNMTSAEVRNCVTRNDSQVNK